MCALVDAGLDHAQITLESHDAAIHDRMVHAAGAWEDTVAGLKNVLATRLYVMTNTTLLTHNAASLSETLAFLAETGVPTVGLNALIYSGHGLEIETGLPESSLPPLLDLARAATTAHDQRLIWYTPTQYCNFNPIQMDLGVKGCTAALYNMCVEPDGSVLPCQSYYQSLGNLLLDPWPAIWNHDLAASLRERRNLPIDCQACALLPECGGGCPLARQANPALRPHTVYDFTLPTGSPNHPIRRFNHVQQNFNRIFRPSNPSPLGSIISRRLLRAVTLPPAPADRTGWDRDPDCQRLHGATSEQHRRRICLSSRPEHPRRPGRG